MIESYAIMAIPLAAVVEYFTKSKRWIKYLSFSIFFLFISHGIFQTFQYYYGAIHWDSMTKKAYFHSFGKLKPSGKFWEYLEEPNYKSAHDGLDEKDEKSEKSK